MSMAGDREDRSPRSGFALAGMAMALMFVVAALTALGVWQIQRLGWKLDLIAQIDARIHAAPVPASGPAAWPAIDAGKDAYRRVAASGAFLDSKPAFVQAATALGSGYWVLSPLKMEQGFVVLVNRGFVLPEQRDEVGNSAGPAQVTGLLRISEPKGGFLRSNDPAADRWYSRDVTAIAQARALSDVAPFFIDAEKGAPGVVPVGGLTVVDLPNNHLVYALTWFALAAMAAGGLIYLVRDEQRIRRKAR